jgi:hypothetical protein
MFSSLASTSKSSSSFLFLVVCIHFFKNSTTFVKPYPIPPLTAPSTSSTIRQTGLDEPPEKCELDDIAFFMASIRSAGDLLSLALIALGSYPHCFAKTLAIVLLPVPGGP